MVEDISIGGMKFNIKKLPTTAIVGTTVVFKLEEAKIKQEIHSNIVKINQEKTDEVAIHVQFYDMSELNRLYLQKFIASKNAKMVK